VASSSASLETRNVTKYFVRRDQVKTEALRDINLSFGNHEFVAIVGASGCGKTTFLRMLGGLIAPSSGSILFNGKEIVGPGNDRGFVFQADSLFPWRTVMSNVILGLEIQGKPLSESRELAQRYIALVGLRGFENHYPHELSGGMRQRVNLARALCINPSLLLMDEPFAALDAQTREIMQAELLRIWNEQRKAVVFITHQIDEAVFLADRVIVFSARPGTVRDIIEIDLPRPRDMTIKRSDKFIQYVDRIWKLIEEEVRQSVLRPS